MYSIVSRARERKHLVEAHVAPALHTSSDFALAEIVPWISMFPSVPGIDMNTLDSISFQKSMSAQRHAIVRTTARQAANAEADEDETKEVLTHDDIADFN